MRIFSLGCEEIQRMQAFRDWLIKNPADRNFYQTEKLKLANKIWRHTQNYAGAKISIVTEIEKRISSAAS